MTVAKEIELDDKFENMGAQMVRSSIAYIQRGGRWNDYGYGVRPCDSQRGRRAVAAGMNPMDLKRGVDLAVAAVVADLKKNSKTVTSNDEIAQVGTISANGDAEIGRFIADAMKKVGNEGVITVEEAQSLATELEVVEGLQFDRGYISPYLVTNADKMRVERPLSPDLRRRNFRPSTSCCRCLRRWCRPSKATRHHRRRSAPSIVCAHWRDQIDLGRDPMPRLSPYGRWKECGGSACKC